MLIKFWFCANLPQLPSILCIFLDNFFVFLDKLGYLNLIHSIFNGFCYMGKDDVTFNIWGTCA